MKLKTIIAALQGQGYSIEYRTRKDGGVLITKINGQKFRGAKGNAMARMLTNQPLTEKRRSQLNRITTTGKRAMNRTPQDPEIKRALERVQRKWNKAFPHKRGESPSVGRVTSKKVNIYLQKYGKEETLRMLEERERYAQGKAYSKNVEILAQFVRSAGESLSSKDLISLADLILENAWKIEESSIAPAYHELYKLNDGVPPEEVARMTRRALKI